MTPSMAMYQASPDADFTRPPRRSEFDVRHPAQRLPLSERSEPPPELRPRGEHPEIRERLEREAPVHEAWMRDLKPRVAHRPASVEQQVQVERSRSHVRVG